jgi:hypothetical protein
MIDDTLGDVRKNRSRTYRISTGGEKMKWYTYALAISFASVSVGYSLPLQAQPPTASQQAYGHQWANSYNTHDWNRLYHYPYVWYPQNYYADGYMKSANDLYHRYPQEMRVPVYNRSWQNYYPKSRRYHQGHHFQLDVF